MENKNYKFDTYQQIIAQVNDDNLTVQDKIGIFTRLFNIRAWGDSVVLPITIGNLDQKARKFIADHGEDFSAYINKWEENRMPYDIMKEKEQSIEGLEEVRSALINVGAFMDFLSFTSERSKEVEKNENSVTELYAKKFPIAYAYAMIEHLEYMSSCTYIATEAKEAILEDPQNYKQTVCDFLCWAQAQIKYA